jgi:hypothetical protein
LIPLPFVIVTAFQSLPEAGEFRGGLPEGVLTLAQLFLDALAVGDVASHAVNELLPGDHLAGPMQPAVRAVFAPEAVLKVR